MTGCCYDSGGKVKKDILMTARVRSTGLHALLAALHLPKRRSQEAAWGCEISWRFSLAQPGRDGGRVGVRADGLLNCTLAALRRLILCQPVQLKGCIVGRRRLSVTAVADIGYCQLGPGVASERSNKVHAQWRCEPPVPRCSDFSTRSVRTANSVGRIGRAHLIGLPHPQGLPGSSLRAMALRENEDACMIGREGARQRIKVTLLA